MARGRVRHRVWPRTNRPLSGVWRLLLPRIALERSIARGYRGRNSVSGRLPEGRRQKAEGSGEETAGASMMCVFRATYPIFLTKRHLFEFDFRFWILDWDGRRDA